MNGRQKNYVITSILLHFSAFFSHFIMFLSTLKNYCVINECAFCFPFLFFFITHTHSLIQRVRFPNASSASLCGFQSLSSLRFSITHTHHLFLSFSSLFISGINGYGPLGNNESEMNIEIDLDIL